MMKNLFQKIKWFFTPFWIKRKIEKRRNIYRCGIVNYVKNISNLDERECNDEIDFINQW